MGFLFSILAGKAGRMAAAALVALGVIVSIFRAGRASQRKDTEIKGLKDYHKTREVIDDVEASDSPDAAFERLRRNGIIR